MEPEYRRQIRHRLTAKQRGELTHHPDAVEKNAVGSDYQALFNAEGDAAVHAKQIAATYLPPTALAQDPYTILLLTDFWMKQYSHRLWRSNEMADILNQLPPYSRLRWSAHAVGEANGLLNVTAHATIRKSADKPFVMGRDHRNTWIYPQWDNATAGWLIHLNFAAYLLAAEKVRRANTGQPWGYRSPAGLGPVLQNLYQVVHDGLPAGPVIADALVEAPPSTKAAVFDINAARGASRSPSQPDQARTGS